MVGIDVQRNMKSTLESILQAWAAWVNEEADGTEKTHYKSASELATLEGTVVAGSKAIRAYFIDLRGRCGGPAKLTATLSKYTKTVGLEDGKVPGEAFIWADFSAQGDKQSVTGSLLHKFTIDSAASWDLRMTVILAETAISTGTDAAPTPPPATAENKTNPSPETTATTATTPPPPTTASTSSTEDKTAPTSTESVGTDTPKTESPTTPEQPQN